MSLAGRLTIDLDAIVANWRALDALTAPNVETAAVIKANAYGCGADQVGAALAKAGAHTFFVALPDEGATLRKALGPDPSIYILAGYPAQNTPSQPGTAQSPPPAGGRVREGAGHYTTHTLRPVLNSAPQATAWFRDAPGAPCAIQLDTGMNRLGMEPAEFAALFAARGPLPASVQLIISHLACADDPANPMNPAQLANFNHLTQQLRGLPRSLAATAGTLLDTNYHFDMTRIGIGLFGGWPFSAGHPAVSLDLPIIQTRDLQPGETVGYGATWTSQRPSRIATLSCGYADGLLRALGNHGTGFINAQPLPFVGRVSMDLINLDVTDCPAAQPGTLVEILGPHQSIDDLATAAATIGHEILTSLGTRYDRSYIA